MPLFIRYLLIIAIVGGLGLTFLSISAGWGQRSVTAQEFINFAESGGVHAGFRRAHAKGFCIAGEFESTGALERYSTARIFAQRTTPFTGRISIGGGNPSAPDLESGVRSLALSIGHTAKERWQTAMNTPPVMAVRNVEDFYQQMQIRDPDQMAAFFEAHPETQAFREWRASYKPTTSFATEQYNSINAFYLIDGNGYKQAVRWSAVPVALPDPDIELDERNPDALRDEFMNRLNSSPVVFDLMFTLAGEDDDETDPTVHWPDERDQVIAGRIYIREAVPETQGQCNAINFDPLVLPSGMAATEDRILRARSAAYAESYRRRARERLLNQVEGADHE